ncbi:Cof-type HAD-IIB family hydrolase [Fusobacterium sp. MFO224]|uniref:Cof-type HAD-IIB family hydrolase n=1 Tax=Fusobacterium sp. MFO224 TaxID=3378070 RepID=UPI0038550893
MKIKAVALDMDGTLLTSNHHPSERTKKFLLELEKRGVTIIIATGRAYYSTLPIIKEIGLKSGFVICYNGANVFNSEDNSLVFQNNLEEEYVKKMIEISRETNTHLNLYQDDILYCEDVNREEVIYYSNKCSIKAHEKDFDTFENYNIPKNLFIAPYEKLIELEKLVLKRTNNNVHTTFSSRIFLEVLNKNTNKGETLKWLLNNLNISLEETCAFGDAENDFEMLKVVKYGVAMGNAQEDFKKRLNYSTLNNDEDGIVEFLKKICK